MHLKKIFLFYFYFSICFQPVFSSVDSAEKTIESLSLLTFHTNDWLDSLTTASFSPLLNGEERKLKWEQAAIYLYQNPIDNQAWQESVFRNAYSLYQEAVVKENQGFLEDARIQLKEAVHLLHTLRNSRIDNYVKETETNEEQFLYTDYTMNLLDDLKKNRFIPEAAKHKMRPYIIPDSHPLRPALDAIFKTARVTQNEESYQASGFITLCERPRTFVRVARHPALPGHLLKLYLDTELRLKHNKETWQWFVKRCQGAKKVREVISRKNIKNFVVADKWIYPLPAFPLPPKDSKHTRHLAVLLVTDMNLANDRLNYYSWKHLITQEQLNELYDIITYAKGHSYRPDNVCLTKDRKYAFIDTEYPSSGPDYRSIRRFLNSSNRKYWDQLTRNGRL